MAGGHARGAVTPPQQLALDTIRGAPTQGIGIFGINPMEWRMIDRLAGVPEGTYERRPVDTYRRMLVNSGVCVVDQWIPDNPLTMRAEGFEGAARTATTGAGEIALDGIAIDSPEAVVRHMEEHLAPSIKAQIAGFDADALVRQLLERERADQDAIGPEMLKAPYTDPFARFPILHYGLYGYEQYFTAYALYPEAMERNFALAADCAVLYNRAAARAIAEGGLPSYVRIDHDITDSRGTLADVKSLDRLWFPHFARSMKPFVDAGVTLVWHSDGNVTPLVERLLDVGFAGFQGFQYEDGVDYVKICGMKARDGEGLLIIAGVSVTRTLPYGTADDVKREMRFLVENGPKSRLFLGASSSIAPGVPWENLKTLVEGFWHYRSAGRNG
jgi:hypothetical protein